MLTRKLNQPTFFLTFLLVPFFAIGQIDTASTVNNNKSEDYSYFMINASYTNNNLENLTGTTEKIPTLFTNVSFTHKSGLYLGGTYASYFNANTNTYEYNLEAGYQKYFDNGFDIDLCYNNHKFSGDTLLAGISYDHSLSLATGIDIENFYLSTNISYLLSQKNNTFLDISFSRFFQIDEIFSKNDLILINPSISFAFGTDYWLYENMTPLERYSTAVDLRTNGYSFNEFSYEAFDIMVPISYGINNIYISFSWLYRIPSEKYKHLGWENQSGFMLSLSYFLNFSKEK